MIFFYKLIVLFICMYSSYGYSFCKYSFVTFLFFTLNLLQSVKVGCFFVIIFDLSQQTCFCFHLFNKIIFCYICTGRPEKLPDVCYSWWVLASLKIIGKLHWIDKVRL